jgi:hypothetical protein
MGLDPGVADLLRREFETIRGVRNPRLQRVILGVESEATKLGARNGSRFAIAVDERCGVEFMLRGKGYLERTVQRLTELREPWTEGLRRDVELLLRQELEKDWTWMLAFRDARLGPKLKDYGTGDLTNAKTTAIRRIEEELGFRVLRQEKRKLPLAELLAAPRYADVRQHWELANEYAERTPPADKEAAREAVFAVEALARLVVVDPDATLGKAIKLLNKRTDDAGRRLFASIEQVWAFSNQARSLRHGGGAGDEVTSPEAQYVVGVAGNAIRLLLVFDLGDHSTDSTAEEGEETPELAKSL